MGQFSLEPRQLFGEPTVCVFILMSLLVYYVFNESKTVMYVSDYAFQFLDLPWPEQ